jgi:hypothetical protein
VWEEKQSGLKGREEWSSHTLCLCEWRGEERRSQGGKERGRGGGERRREGEDEGESSHTLLKLTRWVCNFGAAKSLDLKEMEGPNRMRCRVPRLL